MGTAQCTYEDAARWELLKSLPPCAAVCQIREQTAGGSSWFSSGSSWSSCHAPGAPAPCLAAPRLSCRCGQSLRHTQKRGALVSASSQRTVAQIARVFGPRITRRTAAHLHGGSGRLTQVFDLHGRHDGGMKVATTPQVVVGCGLMRRSCNRRTVITALYLSSIHSIVAPRAKKATLRCSLPRCPASTAHRRANRTTDPHVTAAAVVERPEHEDIGRHSFIDQIIESLAQPAKGSVRPSQA